MTDTLTPTQRSDLMAKIRSINTKPEICVRCIAHSIGLRFRIHRKDLPGKPDLVFPKHKLVVFVHGCFWHRHQGCSRCTTPKTRTEFWEHKFRLNIERDAAVIKKLQELGWRTEIIWECQTKNHSDIKERLEMLTMAGASAPMGRRGGPI